MSQDAPAPKDKKPGPGWPPEFFQCRRSAPVDNSQSPLVPLIIRNPDDITRRGHVPISEVLEELERADGLYPRPFVNYAEGIETVCEEVDELREATRVNPKNRSAADIRKEAIQAAAMLLRFLRDCCPKE